MSGRPTALARARSIREVLLDHGVPEVSIELQQGRPTSGDRWNALDPVGVMSHHIVSSPTPGNPTPGLSLVKRGRAGLPGPLANGTAGVDLVYRIICLGLANHPGVGGPMVLSGPLGNFRVPASVGRPYFWGTEYEGGLSSAVWDRTYTNRRTGKSMTFREFMGRCNAGLVEAIWLPGVNSRGRWDRITPSMDLSTYHVEHSTWTSRKIDRLGYSTRNGRQEIRRYKDKEDDMDYRQWPKASQNALQNDVVEAIMRYKPKGQNLAVEQLLKQAGNSPGVTRQRTNWLRRVLTGGDKADPQ